MAQDCVPRDLLCRRDDGAGGRERKRDSVRVKLSCDGGRDAPPPHDCSQPGPSAPLPPASLAPGVVLSQGHLAGSRPRSARSEIGTRFSQTLVRWGSTHRALIQLDF